MDEGSVLTNMKNSEGRDRIGRYYEATFDYVLEGKLRTSGIRIYEDKPVVIFTANYPQASPNKKTFPKFQCSEEGLYGFSYHDIWTYGFGNPGMGPESPWLFFNGSGNAFIVSPAGNFMVSNMSQDGYRYITSSIDSKITVLPADFSHQVMLVFGNGINKTFDTWGQAMTDLQGKVRPANDADILLEGISAWHSAGGDYYYYEPLEDFARVLMSLRDNFVKQGIRLRHVHFDGWWSQKGKGGYGSSRYIKEGVYLLRPDPAILPYGLAEFQKDLGIPLSVHSRWWSPYSPDRSNYTFSRDVPIDPKYWKNLAIYLKESGVVVFEQDWLNALAAPLRNLNDARDFLNNMAQAMKEAGIAIQYCMP